VANFRSCDDTVLAFSTRNRHTEALTGAEACASRQIVHGFADIITMSRRNKPLLLIEDIIKILRGEIKRAGSQAEWARRTKANRANLNSTLNGNRPPTNDVLRALSLRKVFAYEKQGRAGKKRR
jgi:hypothetical protein